MIRRRPTTGKKKASFDPGPLGQQGYRRGYRHPDLLYPDGLDPSGRPAGPGIRSDRPSVPHRPGLLHLGAGDDSLLLRNAAPGGIKGASYAGAKGSGSVLCLP